MSDVNTANTAATNATTQLSSELTQDKAPQVKANNTENIEKAERLSVVEKQRIAQDAKLVEEEKEAVTITPQQLEKVAQQLQDFIGEMNRSLEFLVDKDSGRDVIKVLDKSTGDLVKQYPSEEVLTLISKLSDATGNLIDTEI